MKCKAFVLCEIDSCKSFVFIWSCYIAWTFNDTRPPLSSTAAGSSSGRDHDHVHADDSVHDEFISFESHAYEALLTTALALYQQEYETIKSAVHRIIPVYESGAVVPVRMQKSIAMMKNRINGMLTHCTGHKRCMLELLEDDETMALMNLTEMKADPSRYNLYADNVISIVFYE